MCSKLVIVRVVFNEKGRRISKGEEEMEEHFIVDHITGFDKICDLVFSRLGSEVIDYIQIAEELDLPYEPVNIEPGFWEKICIYHPPFTPDQEKSIVEVKMSTSTTYIIEPYCGRFDSYGICVKKYRDSDELNKYNLSVFGLVKATDEDIEKYKEMLDLIAKVRVVKQEILRVQNYNSLIEMFGGKQEVEKLYTQIIGHGNI